MDGNAPRRGATNGLIAALLRDYAETQSSPQRAWGYKRAAKAIRMLPAPIEDYLEADGTLRKIANVGPASTRIILEVVRTGGSATVEERVSISARRNEIAKQRGLREHFFSRAEALGVLLEQPAAAALVANFQGDLQMHSTWSDGSQSLQEIIASRSARGYAYSAITDHSYGLPIAGGLSMERVAAQHAEIDRLNAEHDGSFVLLKGIEANIAKDGRLDLQPDELSLFDLVVAAPHSALRVKEDQTARLVAAINCPGVHILGHPRGRMYGSRAGLQVHWPDVFAAAAARRVAIEVDGDPSRQDVDYTLAREALAAGCLLACDTDAHGIADMHFIDFALAHAALAGATPAQIVNCWPLEQLRAWAGSLG